MFKRSQDVPGLGTLTRSWLSKTWRGRVGTVELRLADLAPETVALTRLVLTQDPRPAIAALQAEANDHGTPKIQRLEVRPDGALAVYAVPWDEEHLWGVHLRVDGDVGEVVVSPGP